MSGNAHKAGVDCNSNRLSKATVVSPTSSSNSRCSSIPVRIKSPRNAMSLPTPAMSTASTFSCTPNEVGIMESTPSFLSFTASFDAVTAADGDDDEASEEYPLVHLPTVDDISIGEGRPTGISTTSKSFTGFVKCINTVLVSPPDPAVISLMRGEKFQTSGHDDPESKNEMRHRKHRRLRIANCPVLSEEQFLRMVHTKSSDYQDALEVHSEVSMFKLLEPIQFPKVENKRRLKQLMEETKIPSVFADPVEDEEPSESTPLPVNLKRLSEQDLEPLFALVENRMGPLPVKMSRHIELFPTHDGRGFMGCLFVQNKTPHVITYRIKSSVGGRYEVNPAIGQIAVGSGALVFVQTLENHRLIFEDIKEDRFLVEVIPLVGPFHEVSSIVIFWNCCGSQAKFKFFVNLVQPFSTVESDPVSTKFSDVDLEKLIFSPGSRSEELFQLRLLETDSSTAVGAMAVDKAKADTNYGLVIGAFLFGFALAGFMGTVLFSQNN